MLKAISQTVESVTSRLSQSAAPHQTTASKPAAVAITLVCPDCGSESPSSASAAYYRAGERRTCECPACSTKRRLAKFLKHCPPLYQNSDLSRLPQAQFKQAMTWQYGPRGLALMGDTGKCKSRIAWLLLKRIICEDNPERNFAWFDCISFGHEIARRYREETAEEWLTKMAAIPILFFDDLGKLKLTERAETELFGIVERRCAARLPLIVTTNDSGDSLGARMTENRGPAMIRRLREFCEVISF